MTRIVIATRNAGKLREFAAALAPLGVEPVPLDEIAGAPDDVEETGATYEANARLKAEAYSMHTDLSVVADDSGIDVDALDGGPGVHSARYGGPGLDGAGRNRKLLEALRDVPEDRRTARFRCVLAVARRGKTLATFEGEIEGRVLREPRGSGGFGYDPIFFHPPSGRTTAELTVEEKQRHSHRGNAISKMVEAVGRGELVLD